MRIVLVGAVLAFAVAGCGLANSRYVKANCRISEATIGAPLLTSEQGVKNDACGTVVQSNEQRLIYGGMAGKTIKITYR